MLASAVGNGLEWFDWNIYVVFTPFLTAALFASEDPASSLLQVLAIFGVGFVFRPVGGVLAGYLADRHGRRTVMIATMLTMSAASLLIALTPSFTTAGVWASVMLLVARLVQGLAHGAESTAGYAYIAEIAPAARRGFFSSTLSTGVLVGSMLASALGWGLTAALPAEAMAEWGWRVPFLLGAALSVVVMFLRRRMMESEAVAHIAASDDAPATPEVRRGVFWSGFRIFWFVAAISVVFYTWLTSASTLAQTQHGMDASAAFRSSLVAQAVCVCLMPVAGIVSDRIGRKPVTLTFALGFVVLSFPLMGMISAEPWTLLVAQTVALVFVAMGNSMYSALLSEQLPTRYRARTIGIANSLSVAIFGGTALYLNQWLHGMGMQWAFTLYFVLVCLAAAVAVWFMPERKGVELHAV
ncbi:MFS transporter [Xylanimonas oleitrophica]|uniref:MFS transporter n=2 Tax=Xylanimonas oleitrophica TaxID=2607479 RepID=A0A2W5Y5W0_9MICO|nr:MFS transporter [Xylanimonas oleitrophica]